MKPIWFVLILALVYSVVIAGPSPSGPKEMTSGIYTYEGKLFTGPQDPEYRDYDLALRNRLIKRIHKRFGIELNPKTYSGFDLLEIESFVRCKKSNESLDHFLKMFPKTP